MAQPVFHKHVKTSFAIPIRLGRCTLYEAKAFKMPGEQKTGDVQQEQAQQKKPVFQVELSFDKKRDMDTIKRFRAAQNDAMDEAIDQGTWDETDKAKASCVLKDADKDKVVMSRTDKRKILLADKRPYLRGMWNMHAKNRMRPDMQYMTGNGVLRKFPDPIIDPDPNDPEEIAESQKIEDFWNRMVFEGQYAVVTVTFKAYTLPDGAVGTTARLDRVIILGGGTPVDAVPITEDVSAEDLDEMRRWYKDNVSKFVDTFANEIPETDLRLDRVDDETGEILNEEEDEEPVKPRRTSRRRPVEVEEPEDEDYEDEEEEVEESKPRKRPTRRTRRPEPVDEVEDDEDEEDVEPVKPRRARRKPTSRKTKQVEETDVYDDDDDAEDQPMW